MRIKLYENRDFMRRTQIKLMQEEVHIWCIRWKEVIPVFEYYQLMLDQKEKEKMEEYYFYEDRMRYVAGKVITKLVLIQYLEEEEISFLSHKFGKPYYKSISGKQDIEFNISHSGEMILVAFSRDAKIGVDIQEIIDCSEYLEIARSFFEPEEVKNIEESNSKELFFQYWSAKEAYLKAIGVFIPMSSLQCAYMIERERGLKTTGTPCHVYMEFDTVSINETHLRKAWETLYVRHPMMRAKAEMCGLLKIEELNDREAERTIKIWEEDIFIKENMREILSHEKLDMHE